MSLSRSCALTISVLTLSGELYAAKMWVREVPGKTSAGHDRTVSSVGVAEVKSALLASGFVELVDTEASAHLVATIWAAETDDREEESLVPIKGGASYGIKEGKKLPRGTLRYFLGATLELTDESLPPTAQRHTCNAKTKSTTSAEGWRTAAAQLVECVRGFTPRKLRVGAAAAPAQAPSESGGRTPVAFEVKPGMSEEEVTAGLGVPSKVVTFGTRTIWTYDRFRVVFQSGKVTEVQ